MVAKQTKTELNLSSELYGSSVLVVTYINIVSLFHILFYKSVLLIYFSLFMLTFLSHLSLHSSAYRIWLVCKHGAEVQYSKLKKS